jgi:hypothetical protein
MTADYRLTAFSVGGAEVKRVDLDRAWVAALRAEGFEMRAADVGAAVLVTVATLTSQELARVNAAARRRPNAESSTLVAHLRTNELRCCDEVDEVMRWVGAASYFSPWFVIEGVDID